MKIFFRRPLKVDPEELNRQSDEINAQLESESERMNSIAAYLEKRKKQNGFGRDFEFTLRPKEAR